MSHVHASPARGWSGGYYADPSSPIASTPQRSKSKKQPSTPSAAQLSPLRSPPEKPVARKLETALATEGTDDPFFSPPLKSYEDGDDSMEMDTPAPTPASSYSVSGGGGGGSYSSTATTTEITTRTYEMEVEEEEEEEEAHLEYEEFNPYFFIKCLPPYRAVAHNRPPIRTPPKKKGAPDVTLVLDLDETLVHCSVEKIPDADLQFPVLFNGIEYEVYVRKRPYLDRFLAAVAQKFEVIIFTASQPVYAERLLDLLDPKRKYITHRLFRDSCLNVEGNFLKDLTVVNRDLRKAVLVDNSPHAFGYQIDNGIPIESWFEDKNDKELLKLIAFLNTLEGVPDVRKVVREKFRVHKLIAEARMSGF